MVEQLQIKPEMTFRDLVDRLTEAANITDPFESWLVHELATATALASEHHAGCEHHVQCIVLEQVLVRYRQTKKS